MKFNRREALKSFIGSGAVGLQGRHTEKAPDTAGPKAMVRAFAHAINRRDAADLPRYVKGASNPFDITKFLSSDLFTLPDFELQDVFAEVHDDTAAVAAKLSFSALAAIGSPQINRLLHITEILTLEKQGTIWRCIPDPDLVNSLLNLDVNSNVFMIAMGRPLNGMAALISTGHELSRTIKDREAQQRRNGCISNLRQIGLASLMYGQDHDDVYPQMSPSYVEQLEPYTKNRLLFTCPDDEKGRISYTFNANLCGVSPRAIAFPERTVLIYEGSDMHLDYRHAGEAVVVYADGRATPVDASKANTLLWYPTG